MQITPHFSLEEFSRSDTAIAHGIANIPPAAHLDNIKWTLNHFERVRALLGGPIVFSSGYRNPEVNALVGGVSNSDHALGYAGDFSCPTFGTPFEVCGFLAARLQVFDQLIHERKPGSWWVHLSFNPRMRRQLLTLTGPGKYAAGIIMPKPWR